MVYKKITAKTSKMLLHTCKLMVIVSTAVSVPSSSSHRFSRDDVLAAEPTVDDTTMITGLLGSVRVLGTIVGSHARLMIAFM